MSGDDNLRAQYLGEVKAVTAHYRDRAAKRLEARGREVASERAQKWIASGMVTNVFRMRSLLWFTKGQKSGLVARDHRGRAVESAPRESRWHTARANGKLSLFERVGRCGKGEGPKLKITCRGCSEVLSFEVGCGSQMFCTTCRHRTAAKFRKDFEQKRAGLLAAADRAGLRDRWRRRADGGRFSEKLVTLTIPHDGLHVRDRIQLLLKVEKKFWRLFRDWMADLEFGSKGKAKRLSAIDSALEQLTTNDDGEVTATRKLMLADFVQHMRVLEWTPGSDGDGHPHLHVWFFSPFIAKEKLSELWVAAYNHAITEFKGKRLARRETLNVDIREAGEDVAGELIKYLVKDWSTGERVRPEVMGWVYAELDGRRMRQSSAGFSSFALVQACACPACGHHEHRRHWGIVEICSPSLVVPEDKRMIARAPPSASNSPRPSFGFSRELQAVLRRYDERRDQEWLANPDQRALERRMRAVLGERAKPLSWQQLEMELAPCPF